MSLRSKLGTAAAVALYATLMICTNNIYTILDDESTIIAVAGHPISSTVKLFLTGKGQHEHPPVSDLLLHLWLVATSYSFFSLRIFANIFYIGAVLFIAFAAKRIGGNASYWTALLVAFAWPFAFQYARLTGWYAFCTFLVAWLTWIYLRILEDQGPRPWIAFGIVGVLLVWTNYFGVALLLLLLADLLLFHRKLAVKNLRWILGIAAMLVISFLPLLKVVLTNVETKAAPALANGGLKGAIATLGYPAFSIFASSAVAPWYLPLCIPILLAIVALFIAMWFSPSRRWLIYFLLAMMLLQLSGHMNIKRVLFLMPWLFLAMALAAFSDSARYPKAARTAIAVIVLVGWIGIVSGKHYSTTNLYEPWGQVARVVADDARQGATVVSENFPFFFYLDYQLGLQAETQAAPGSFLGQPVYQTYGYTILEPRDWPNRAPRHLGKVVLVNGSALDEDVQLEKAIDRDLHARCRMLGEYQAAPDPAAAWKQRMVKGAAVLPYRVDVIWYDCTGQDR